MAALAVNVFSVVGGIALGWQLFMPALAYLGGCAIWGGILAHQKSDAACLASGLAAIVMHHSWAIGFVFRGAGLITSK
jgi:succinoglycan biosynthesis protein ExoA